MTTTSLSNVVTPVMLDAVYEEKKGMSPRSPSPTEESKQLLLEVKDGEQEEFEPEYKCEIMGTQTREDDDEKNKYTVYEIKVKDEQGKESYVFRRYREFQKLHEIVSQKYPEFAEECPLPSTSWFFKFHKDTIEERKEKFQHMLDVLMNTRKYFTIPEVREFIKQDLQNLHKALSYFRAKLYQYKQHKDYEMTDEMKNKMEKAQEMVKILNRIVRSESFKKAHANISQVEEK